MKRRSLLLLLWLTSIIASCDRSREPSKVSEPPARRELVVAAAASLKESFTEVARRLEEETPGLDVTLTFGASNMLARQISSGAPVDLFASAAEDVVDSLAAKGMVDGGSRVTFATNSLVVVGAKGTAPLSGMNREEWSRFERIAVAGPGVPVRGYSEEALRAVGLWDPLEPRFVFGANVRQVLDYVAAGEADAGIVYGTDAATMPDKVTVLATIPDSLHRKISYPAVIVARGRNRADAERFLKLLTGPEGTKILERYGFVKRARN